MYPNEKTVIHDVYFFQELCVSFELLGQKCPFLRPQLQSFSPVDPVEVLQGDLVLFLDSHFLWVESTNSTPLEIVCFVDVFMRWEKVVHDDKVDLPPSW